MLKLATVLDNPGEPTSETRYRDPRELSELGYNGAVIYQTVGLSGVDAPDSVGSGEMRRWVEHQFEQIRTQIEKARAAGLDVFIAYDVLTLPHEIVDRDPKNFLCKNRKDVLCPAADLALERSAQSLERLLGRLPAVEGVVLRFGDSNAPRLPYLLGNDLYLPHCPRCSGVTAADRIVGVLDAFHRLIVERMNKRLIARAWNVRPGGMHDSPDVARDVAARLPGEETDPRFILSFKFTHSDFWRYQAWNICSFEFGNRPILYELQCQREFEGKGGVPNWQPPLWRDGSTTSKERSIPAGVATVHKKINLAGLWAWVRGGGWGGPFVTHEAWIDANVVAVPKLADNPESDLDTLASLWIHGRLGVESPEVVASLRRILDHSPDFARRGFYIDAYARHKRSMWHPNGDIIQDDVIDAQAAWRLVQRLPDHTLDGVVEEKQQAVELVAADRAALQTLVTDRNRKLLDPLVNTLIYAESLFETLRDLLAGLIAYRRWLRTHDVNEAESARQRLLAAQSHWNHHTQRHGAMAGVATAFRESGFWELTQKILGEIVDT